MGPSPLGVLDSQEGSHVWAAVAQAVLIQFLSQSSMSGPNVYKWSSFSALATWPCTKGSADNGSPQLELHSALGWGGVSLTHRIPQTSPSCQYCREGMN